MPKVYIVFTDAERDFINAAFGQPLDQPVSAAVVRRIARQWAIWTQREVGDLFLPRERGENLRQVPREKKSAAAKKRWQTDGQEARNQQGKIMRAARKRRPRSE